PFTASTPRLVNVSARCQVDSTGAGSLIAGFVIGGSTCETVLIRGIGPGLTAYGVPGVLPDPTLDVHTTINNQDTVLAANDDRSGDAVLTTVFKQVGAFALTDTASKDAALIVTLPPGAYTANLNANGATGGVGLIEVYEVP
ncbi:MAG: hypothetical protein ACREFX_07700, partial [Opitutaceae bacterium]